MMGEFGKWFNNHIDYDYDQLVIANAFIEPYLVKQAWQESAKQATKRIVRMVRDEANECFNWSETQAILNELADRIEGE